MIRFLRLGIILSYFGSQISTCSALSLEGVQVQDVSSTKKTIVIDRGLLEKYKENLSAKFFIQTGDKEMPKIFLVATGKLIKSLPTKSIWYLNQIELPDLVSTKSHLLILTSNDVKNGRQLKIYQKHIVAAPNQYSSVDEYLDQNKNMVPDRLVKESNHYEELDELYETEKKAEGDVSIKTFENYKNSSGMHLSDVYNDEIKEKYFVGNLELVLGDLTNLEDQKLLKSVSDGMIEKTNSEKYGLTNGLYKNSKKDENIRDLSTKLSISSVYDTAKEDRKAEEQISPTALAKMKRDGPHWSEDMDDEALRRYFIQSGMLHEERRRELALNELDGNEVMFHFSGSMIDHTSSLDQNYQTRGYSLGLGYDLHLSRTSKELKNWSLQFILEKGVSDYDLGGINGRGQEGTYGAYLNYYIINNPLTLHSFIWLLGAGIKVGAVDMVSPTLSKKYSYQSMCLPAFQLMTKYRFRSGDLTEETVNIGSSLNAGINIDTKHLSAIDSVTDNINGKILVNDIKYLLGMSFYF